MLQGKHHAPRLHFQVLAALASLLVATAACSGGASAGDGAGPEGQAPRSSSSSASAAPPSSAGAGAGAGSEAAAAALDDGAFTGTPAESRRLVTYHRSIQLTPEQEAVRVAALSSLPAPCCSNFSAATCCCECNMARATWGLAKHLIAEKGYGAEEVREAVASWHRAINPDGFSGRACFTGGCGRAFRHDGCGGMVDGELIF